MTIQPITDYKKWNELFETCGSPTFLQTWEWGDLQEKLSYSVDRIAVYDGKKVMAIAQIIKIKARRGSFLFIPHGPLFDPSLSPKKIQAVLAEVTIFLRKKAIKEGFDFIRVSPILEDTPEHKELFTKVGYKKAPLYMHAEHIWGLPLNKSEDELLSDMRKTTRYLIKRAPRDGVVIERRTDDAAVEIFMKLYAETAVREHFTPFSHDYILHELHSFLKTGNALFLFGKVGDQYLAGALIIFTKSTGFYHQGASIHTKLPVPYLLQWEAIRETKKRGCFFYSFWGIAPDEDKNHPWAGLTQFKKGYSGIQINYLETMDLPITPKYWMIWGYEKILRWRRGV